MARRRKRGINGTLVEPHVRLDADWIVTTEWKSPTGRWLRPGVEFKVKGVRGRFRFGEHVRTPAGVEWITCYGGPNKEVLTRSFRPERVTRVFTTRKIISGQEAIALMRAKAAAKGAS